MNDQHCLRVVSLFAGIGGLTCALDRLGIKTEIVCLLDISRECRAAWLSAKGRENADCVKALESKYMVKDVMTVDFSRIGDADIWLLSPPCQPFTKGGKELHEKDPRAQAFLRVIEVLEKSNPPLIFIENVTGFGASESYRRFRKAMEENYEIYEYYRSPTDIGIPYERNRFYCVARRRDSLNGSVGEPKGIDEVDKKPLMGYIDPSIADEKYFIPASKLSKMKNYKFDLVDLTSYNPKGPVGTFTGGYGEYLGKTGPVIRVGTKEGSTESAMESSTENRFRTIDPQSDLIRRFSPNEILALHGFPDQWHFDSDCPFSLRLQYKLVGNSVS